MKSTVFTVALFGAIAVLIPAANGIEPRAASGQPALVKVTNQVTPHFPQRLLRQGVTHGEAVVALGIDPDGKISDFVIVRYTHRMLADVALDAVKQWRFKIAQPVGVVMEITFQFEQAGVVAIERYGTDFMDQPSSDFEYAYQPCAAAELDHPLKPTHVVPPMYSHTMEEQGYTGSVSVNFYIDEKGHPRLVAPIASDNPVLASLATAAVEQWQFEPPTRDGKPVIVHASQRFAFGK